MHINNRIFKFAIIGSGYMATEHAKAINDSPECSISGIFSTNQFTSKILALRFNISNVEQSIYNLYHNNIPDIVIVCVSELSCIDVCYEVFNYPWRILLEKPVGYNFEQATFIHNLSISRKSEVYVALNRRQYSSTKSVLNDCSILNEERTVLISDQENIIHSIKSGTPEIVAKNYMYVNSIHLIDYLNIFCRGSLISIQNIIKWNPNKPKFVLSILHFSSGDTGIYQAIWNAPGPWSVSINTYSYRWEMRPLERAVKLSLNSRTPEEIPLHDWDLKFKPGIRSQINEVVNLLKNKKHSLVSIHEAMISINFVNKIYES